MKIEFKKLKNGEVLAKRGDEYYVWSEDIWLPKSAFVHSSDWVGVFHTNLDELKKILKNSNTLYEVAPPTQEAEDWINSSKESFKDQYGKDWKKVLYSTAWKKFGKKNIEENNLISVKHGDIEGPLRDNMSFMEAKKYLDQYPNGVLHHDIFEKNNFVFKNIKGEYKFYDAYEDMVLSWSWSDDIENLTDDSAYKTYDIFNDWWYEPASELDQLEYDHNVKSSDFLKKLQLNEHIDPTSYVNKWRSNGFEIDYEDYIPSNSSEVGKKFYVKNKNLTATITEPKTGEYHLDISDEIYPSFDSAMEELLNTTFKDKFVTENTTMKKDILTEMKKLAGIETIKESKTDIYDVYSKIKNIAESIDYDSEKYSIEMDRMGNYIIKNKTTDTEVYLQGDDARSFEFDVTDNEKFWNLEQDRQDHILSQYDDVMESDISEAPIHKTVTLPKHIPSVGNMKLAYNAPSGKYFVIYKDTKKAVDKERFYTKNDAKAHMEKLNKPMNESKKIVHKEKDSSKEVKVYYDSDDQEYCVKLFKDGKHYEPADYFTDDKEDAIGTAKSMMSK